MDTVNDLLLDTIEELKGIVWQVNTRLKTKRQVVQLVKKYSDTIIDWTTKINQLVISGDYANRKQVELKIAGYTGPVIKINEDDLVTVLGSFKESEFKVFLFLNDKKVEIMDMPLLVAEIKKIEGALEKIEDWTDPVARHETIPQPVIQPHRRQYPPRRNNQQPRDNSSRKLKQSFHFQFKSLLRIIMRI